MEQCKYCGQVYHPMPRWSPKERMDKNAPTIYVCERDFSGVKMKPSECPAKATADGYVIRWDLTPRR